MVKGLRKALDEGHEKTKGMEYMGLLANILMIATYCSIRPALAEYQDIKNLYYISTVTVYVMGIYAIWQGFCLLGTKRLSGLYRGIRKRLGYVAYNVKNHRAIRFPVYVAAVMAVIILYNWHNTVYYASVEEIYGIPKEVGMPLLSGERKEWSDYWKIEEYPLRKRVQLTYMESYHQLDIMREYSTVYNMERFQPSARIVYTYKNEDKYRSYGEEFYMIARKQGFREPQKISYYNSSGKLLLGQQRRDGDKFQILVYSSEDMP